MNCSYCGYEISHKDNFCKRCGTVFWVKTLESGLFAIIVIVLWGLILSYLFPPLFEALIKEESSLKASAFILFLVVSAAVIFIIPSKEMASAWRIHRRFRECDAVPPRHDCPDLKYEGQHSCIQVGNCRRCGNEVRQTAHTEWTDWNYLSDTSCLEVRTCQRCRTEEQRGPSHLWKSVRTEEYLSDTYDYGEVLYRLEDFQCQRCGAKEQKSIQ
jgi:hypothetical protein